MLFLTKLKKKLIKTRSHPDKISSILFFKGFFYNKPLNLKKRSKPIFSNLIKKSLKKKLTQVIRIKKSLNDLK